MIGSTQRTSSLERENHIMPSVDEGERATGEAELIAQLLALLHTVDERASNAHPEIVEGLSQGQTIVLGLHASARRLYRGIVVLLDHRMAEESQFLARTL